MSKDYRQFERRKQDHIRLALMDANQALESNRLDGIQLIHEALPDLNFSDISIQSERFGRIVPTPFIVGSMTAGHQEAATVNRHLMTACAQCNWAMGVGSQRRELDDPDAAFDWKSLIRDFPDVSLFSNLGISQLITTPLSTIQRLIDSIRAQALIIHCNPLQECIQPEGTPIFKGSWKALATLVKMIEIPIIVKETGCGFSHHTLTRLNELGIAAVDMSGLGGTHWGRIEGLRASHDSIRQRVSKTFSNWGIDTVTCVESATAIQPTFEIWGSGGVRHGLDAAKLIALGASTVSFAQPLLTAALTSAQEVAQIMNSIAYELKTAMFCTGSQLLHDLRRRHATI